MCLGWSCYVSCLNIFSGYFAILILRKYLKSGELEFEGKKESSRKG